MTSAHPASDRLRHLLRTAFTFQISVDTDNLPQGLVVAGAALAAGITLVEMGTPLLKLAGVNNVVPAFRQRFPEALLLADMKTMDGGGGEARAVFAGGGNIIDFLAIAGRFSTVFIDHVPVLGEGKRNEAKRFILLIDTLYDHHTRLVVSAEAPPPQLYTAKRGNEVFEFERTASRLIEMQSRDWLEDWAGRRKAKAPTEASQAQA